MTKHVDASTPASDRPAFEINDSPKVTQAMITRVLSFLNRSGHLAIMPLTTQDDMVQKGVLETEITEDMLTAGEQILEECASYFDERVLASMIYTAMELAKHQREHS